MSRAAAAGNALAECYMGIAFADGTGVPKNGLKAMDWFRASARDGCAAAFDYLGHGYESGLDGPRDSARAFQYYQQAAALGHGAGLWDAGVACQEGRGTTKDPVEALKWLQLADEAGYRAAVPRRGELEASLDATRKEEARRRAREFQPAKTYSVPLLIGDERP